MTSCPSETSAIVLSRRAWRRAAVIKKRSSAESSAISTKYVSFASLLMIGARLRAFKMAPAGFLILNHRPKSLLRKGKNREKVLTSVGARPRRHAFLFYLRGCDRIGCSAHSHVSVAAFF